MTTFTAGEEPVDETWQETAYRMQNRMLELVGHYKWDAFDKSEQENLFKKVQLCFSNNIQESNECYHIVKEICNKIIENGNREFCGKDRILMSFILIYYNESECMKCQPVFKVPKDKEGSEAYFIDIFSRVYVSWQDFLNNNKFPPCEYCYPRGGNYVCDNESNVVVKFEKSPASKSSKHLIECLDKSNALLAFGTLAVGVTSLAFPVAAPILQASSWAARAISVYSVARSGSTLYDRRSHHQKIGWRDAESRSCWLSIGCSIFGAASNGASKATAKIAQSGGVLGKTGCAVVNLLTAGSFVTNGLGLFFSFKSLVNKYRREELTTLDALQFSAHLLLFFHAAVNIKTAQSIIEEAQNNTMEYYENILRSNRHKKMYRKIVRNTKDGLSNVEGNARVIRSLIHIENIDDFFAALVRMDKQFYKTGSKASFAEGDGIYINQNFKVDPIHLVQASPKERTMILEATKRCVSSQMSEADLISMTEGILGKEPIGNSSFPKYNMLKELQIYIKDGIKLGKDCEYPRVKCSWTLLNAAEKEDLLKLLQKFDEKDCYHILKVAEVLLKALGYTQGLEFIQVISFICGLIRGIARYSRIGQNKRMSYQNISLDLCKDALKIALKDPSKLIEIFKLVKMMYEDVVKCCSNKDVRIPLSLYDIAELLHVFLIMDQPLWIKLFSVVKVVFEKLGLSSASQRTMVLKRLSEIVYEIFLGAGMNIEDLDRNAEPEERNNMILNTILNDEEVTSNLIEKAVNDWTQNREYAD